MLTFDIHTHTIASGHGTKDTIADMAREAGKRGLTTLGISDHGPATTGAAYLSYFCSLSQSPRTRFGVSLLYGAEVNILEGGLLDLPDTVLQNLDFCIASMHMPPRKKNRGSVLSGSVEENTADYLTAMQNPYVRILGHCDNTQFPVDYVRIADAAARCGTIVEVNNASLTPGGYHQIPGVSTRDNYAELLLLCKARRVPILLSSDTHGHQGIGQAEEAERLARALSYPEELIVNYHPGLLFM